MDIRQEKLDRLHYSSHIEATLCRIVFSALRKRPPFILGGRVMRTGYKMLQAVTAALVKAGFSVYDERGHTIVGVYRKI